MKLAHLLLATAVIAAPVAAQAQDSSAPAPTGSDCSVSGGSCSTPPSGPQPNTVPDSTQEGGSGGSSSSSGTLQDTSPGTSIDPGQSSGSGSSSSGGGAAGPLGNSTPE